MYKFSDSRQFIRYRTYKFQKTVEICIASEAYLPRCKRYSSRIGLYYPECRGFSGAHPGRGSAGRERITRALIDPNVFSGGVEQLSMFSPPAVDRLVEQGVPPRTAQKMVREEAVQCLARAL